jgi:hypothetical protein
LAVLIERFEIPAHCFGLLRVSFDVFQQIRAGENSGGLEADKGQSD